MKKLSIVVMVLISLSAFAQLAPRPRNSGGGFSNNGLSGGNCLVPGYRGSGAEDLPTPRKIDRSGFVYGRLRYHPVPDWYQRSRGNPELPWHHDYPDGDTMFPTALKRLTAVHTTEESYQLVDIDSKELFKYPFVYLGEPGQLDLLPDDVKNLREYLDRGGFILADDFRANEQDYSHMENWIVQLKKLYPDREMVPVPKTHPIFHIFFDIDPTNMLPPYRQWNSGDPQFLGIVDDLNRIRIMINFNNDTSEYWQALDIGQCSINESGMAVQLGVNYAIYALTH